MSTLTSQSDSGFQRTQPTDWSYTSGRISVLETTLLNRAFFEGLLKARTIGDARSTLSKSAYRQVFTSDEAVRDYLGALDEYRREQETELFGDLPPHVMLPFFDLTSRYVLFRTLFLRAVTRNAGVMELEHAFSALAATEAESQALALHKDMLRSREAPQHADAVGLSLFLDSAVCTLKIALAGQAPEPAVARLLNDLAVLQTWAAIIRSRWNNTPAEIVQRWFILPEDRRDFVRTATITAELNPVQALSGAVSDAVFLKMKSLGTDYLRKNIDAAVREAIRDQVIDYRMIPYGPEKVLAYLIAREVELENLKLSLASVVNGMDPASVNERLRREYA